MRPILLALFVAVASTADADLVEFSLRTTSVVGPVDGPHEILARFAPGHPTVPDVILHVPVTPADEGMAWSVTQANAASFNFDWALFDSFITSPLDLRFSINMRSDGGTHIPGALYESCQPARCILDFEAERIDVTLHQFDLNPRRVDYSVALIGTGRIVPEPSSLDLAFWALILLSSVWQSPRGRRRR